MQTHVEKPVQKKKDAYTKSSLNLLKLAEDESFLSTSFGLLFYVLITIIKIN